MMMKRYAILIFAAVAALAGCAKSASVGLNESSKRYLEAYMQTHYPAATKTALGSYVISSEAGSGALIGNSDASPYVRVEYNVYDLDGNVSSTTSKTLAQRVGLYDEDGGSYYGPLIWYRPSNSLYVGLDELVASMKAGGKVDAIIPGWLVTYDEYDTASEYEANCSGTTARYELTVLEGISDIEQWEVDSISRYFQRCMPSVSLADSLYYGMYYFTTKEPTDTVKFGADSTFYINYVGRFLDGTVFDTNIKDTAKVYEIYNSSSTYTPQEVVMAEEYSDVTMGDNSIITGFAYALMQMRPYESGTAIFTSTYGYGTSGSGAISGYTPLRFDIEVVDEED